MTRDPDRYEARARELDRWIVRHYGVPESYTSVNEIAAALRQAADEALDEVRQYVEAMPVCTRVGVLGLLDDMKSPAAAPAAETGRCFCGKKAMSPSTALVGGSSGTHTATRCDPDALDPLRAIAYAVGSAESPVPPSEPVAPAASEIPRERHELVVRVADRRALRIAELEGLLREAQRRTPDLDFAARIGTALASPAAQGKETRK